MKVRRIIRNTWRQCIPWLLDNVIDNAIYMLGPILVVVALVITSGLSYTFFTIILPMITHQEEGKATVISIKWAFHVCTVLFLILNTMYNYYRCVTTSNKGIHYNNVIRELAEACDFNYPETNEEVLSFRNQFEQKIIERRRQRQAQQNNNVPYAWMLLAPTEWGYCFRSNQPKPPRAHYDHVTSTLVLNMDHFCPWMFNTVGYFNYRYFINFLLFVCMSMLYGVCITYIPFQNLSSKYYKEQIKQSSLMKLSTVKHIYPLVPTPVEKTSIALTFMLCLSIGIAVLCLLLFHIYLIVTAQTTVEFHGNWANKRRARKRGTTWINPYDLGWKDNYKLIYGSTRHPIKAIFLPSPRQPEFLPIPINGELVRRHYKADTNTKQSNSLSNGHERHAGPFNV